MVYEYITIRYKTGEPIFSDDLPCTSRNALRQEMKRLVDQGRLKRLMPGVYCLPYKTIFGTEGHVPLEKIVEGRYIKSRGKTIGYLTGLNLANLYGFITQVPAGYEVCSNRATTKRRRVSVLGRDVIIYRPAAEITPENKSALQFLDLMSWIDRVSEIRGLEFAERSAAFANGIGVDYAEVRKYIALFPDSTYRNIYDGGLMDELVRE